MPWVVQRERRTDSGSTPGRTDDIEPAVQRLAARYSPGHAVSVRARAVGPRVMVRIVDRGPGIPTAEIGRIFEPFYRPTSDHSAHSGSGLGLAIARGFVEANGGRVWAESLPGEGATFAATLPLEVAGAALEGPPKPAGAP